MCKEEVFSLSVPFCAFIAHICRPAIPHIWHTSIYPHISHTWELVSHSCSFLSVAVTLRAETLGLYRVELFGPFAPVPVDQSQTTLTARPVRRKSRMSYSTLASEAEDETDALHRMLSGNDPRSLAKASVSSRPSAAAALASEAEDETDALKPLQRYAEVG